MPDLVKRYFSEADFDAITAAIGRAETSTSAEIVVRIAERCHGWLTERLVAGAVVALLAMVASLYLTRTSDWGIFYDFQQATLWGIIGFVIGYLLWMFLFQSPSRKRKLVWKRASRAFDTIQRTANKTGVLILLSLAERQAAIVVDSAVAAAVEDDYWNKPLETIVAGMKGGDHSEGVVNAIAEISDELKAKLPIDPDDINELPNRPETI